MMMIMVVVVMSGFSFRLFKGEYILSRTVFEQIFVEFSYIP